MHINHIAHMYHRNRNYVQRNSSCFSSKIKRSALAVFVGLPKLCWQAMQLAMQILSQTRSFNTPWDKVPRNNSFYPWIAPFRWEGVCVYQKYAFVDLCKKRNSHILTLQSHWLWDTVCSFSLWTTSLLGWEGILHISKAVYLAPGDDANGHLLRITQLLTPRFNNIETGTNSDQTHSKSHYNSKTDPKKNLQVCMSYIIRGHFYTWGPNSVWDILSCCRWHLVMWSWFIICHFWSKLSSKRAQNQYDKWAFLHFRTFSPAAADTQLSGLDWCPPSHFHQHPFSSPHTNRWLALPC